MTPRTRWAVVWASWATAFAVAETIAVRSDKGVPLCHFIRPILGTHAHPVHRAAGVAALAGFAGWFVPHLYRRTAQPKG